MASTIRILVIEGHALMCAGLEALLAGAPDLAVIGAAHDARDMLRLVAERSPDVVLMDISSAAQDGLETLRELRRQGVRTPVIALSTHSTAAHVTEAFSAGADGYLLKHVADIELVSAVRVVKAGRRYMSEVLSGLEGAAGMPSPEATLLRQLSVRERQVLELILNGKSTTASAEALRVSPKSVEAYRGRVMKKLGVIGEAALLRFALDHGLARSM